MYLVWLKYTVKGPIASSRKNWIQRCRLSVSTPATHYDTLGIGRQANTKEIKQAYICLCKKLHPDANPSDPQAQQKFIQLQDAYNILSDPKERASYDVQMYKELHSRANVKQTYTTHSTEHMSEQEVMQRFYKRHQEIYEEWARKNKSQSSTNTHQHWNENRQQAYDDPKEWSGPGNFNPHDEVSFRVYRYLSMLSVADLFLITAFGKVISLFLMMYLLYSYYKKF
ncbi:uncharacterized protein LOC125652276 isoform X2 [Ostrea edulis]|uniref:uncharacterized protein LOC125652276 isoform X2 n=1 Tax=Ostrea edulis TaxID=37623 RepID=UPI002094C5D3|nr:uncharacterized protein LOC125652276 isoform X2 [Ostrea edulis]XP_056023033.1 uncharacterized protein LOC125652276 isoform X2 [Ostrea edulis]